jgi:F420H(2)-dependent quinone reductase
MNSESSRSNDRPPHPDPAEQSGYLKYFYRDWRPTRFARLWNRAYAWVAGLGILPPLLATLQVRDRRDGRLRSTILVVASHGEDRYLVSMLGNESDWVQNVRAAGGEAAIKRGRVVPVHLTEIPPEERSAILKDWCQIASSGRKHLPVSPDAPLTEFNKIAPSHPVFRIDPAQPPS